LADVLLPVDGGQWRMVEVKSSTSVKPYHRDDVALQARLARSQGIDLAGVSVAHVDSSWVSRWRRLPRSADRSGPDRGSTGP
jgi:hypothetical protein